MEAGGATVLKEGFLSKQGHVMKNWKLRYFRLTGNRLEYFKSTSSRQPQGVFIVTGDCTCGPATVGTRGFGIQLQTSRVALLLSAATEAEQGEWISAITSARDMSHLDRFMGLNLGTAADLKLESGLDDAKTSDTIEGVLRIVVLRATELHATDPRSCNAICIIHVGSVSKSTKVFPKTNAPSWNQVLEFPFARNVKFATVEVYDKELLGTSEFLGRAIVPLGHIGESSSQEWHLLGRRTGKSHGTGEVLLELSTDVPRDAWMWKEFSFVRQLQPFSTPLMPAADHSFMGSARSSVARRGAESTITDLPPYQTEFVEDLREVRACAACDGVPVEDVGILYLSNYRLLFVSSSSVGALAARATRRLPADLAQVIAHRRARQSTIASPRGPAHTRGFSAASDASTVEPAAEETVIVDGSLTITARADVDDDPVPPQSLSTSIPLGSVVSVRMGKEGAHQTLTVTCRDFRTIAFKFLPTNSVPPSSSGLTLEQFQELQLSPTGAVSAARGGDRHTNSFDSSITSDGSIHRPVHRLRDLQVRPDLPDVDCLREAEVGCARFYARLWHRTLNMNCEVVAATRVHADLLLTLMALSNAPALGIGARRATTADSLNIGSPGSLVRSISTGSALPTGSIGANRRLSLSTRVLEQVGQSYGMLMTGWRVYDVTAEHERLGVPNNQWRLCTVNRDYVLCPTYPAVFGVPASLTDEQVIAAAAFRSKRRLPVLSWRHPVSGASITRCSQPMVGLGNARSSFDELLLEEIRKASKVPADHLLIVDARPKLNAQANKTQGKGFEPTGKGTGYPNCRLEFMDIENIHVMRRSHDVLHALCCDSQAAVSSSADNKAWFAAVQDWLEHIARLLHSAMVIVENVHHRGVSVLVHCSDGWDRTAQLCSLACLLLEPYYRTIRGFQVLIEREWLSFGHKFGQRNGWTDKGYVDSDRSPIFLQFLDASFQCVSQMPHEFEFNTGMLECIAEHYANGWFGTFLFDCEREREEAGIRNTCLSLWSFLELNRDLFANPDYRPVAPAALKPQTFPDGSRQRLWYDSHVLMPSSSLRTLRLWNGFYLRWSDTANRVAWQQRCSQHSAQQTNRREELARVTEELVQAWEATGEGDGTQDDNDRKCFKCSRAFTFFRRKRFCSSCGSAFCANCCSYQRIVPHRSAAAMARVCESCATAIDVATGRAVTAAVPTGSVTPSQRSPPTGSSRSASPAPSTPAAGSAAPPPLPARPSPAIAAAAASTSSPATMSAPIATAVSATPAPPPLPPRSVPLLIQVPTDGDFLWREAPASRPTHPTTSFGTVADGTTDSTDDDDDDDDDGGEEAEDSDFDDDEDEEDAEATAEHS